MGNKSETNAAKPLLIIVAIGGAFMLFCGGFGLVLGIPAYNRYMAQTRALDADMVTHQMAQYAVDAWEARCAYPPELRGTIDLEKCCGDEECIPAGVVPDAWAAAAPGIWEAGHFSYSAREGGQTGMTITAVGDLDCGGARHTITIEVEGTKVGDDCEATSGVVITENQFQ